MSALLEQLNLGVGDVVDKVRRSLVQVHNGGRGAGSGVIWHRDGLIITNAHVVSDNGRRPDKKGKLRVTLPDGTTLPARLLARDEDRDVAALLVEAQELAPIELGTSRDLQPGRWCWRWAIPGVWPVRPPRESSSAPERTCPGPPHRPASGSPSVSS